MVALFSFGCLCFLNPCANKNLIHDTYAWVYPDQGRKLLGRKTRQESYEPWVKTTQISLHTHTFRPKNI